VVNRPKIYVCTVAYNAEKTIRRAVESVLNQTYTNIVYCIRDNGSTDQTYSICKEYAAQDDRIILLHNAKNYVYETDEERAHYKIELGFRFGDSLGEPDFFCLLDADDEYLPDFFRRGVTFAEEENLDIVIGGSELVDTQTSKTIGRRTHDHEWVIRGQGFADRFQQYHWHMRQVWGKLYGRNVLLGYREYLRAFMKEYLKEKASMRFSYGADTINALYSFSKADTVGVLSGCCHRYYIHPASISYNYDASRIVSDRTLDELTRSFVRNKCGIISLENNFFLLAVYFNSVCDTLGVLLGAPLAISEKIQNIQNIVTHEKTQVLFNRNVVPSGELNGRIRDPIVQWLLNQKECRKPEGAKATAEILFAMYPDQLQPIAQDSLEYLFMKLPKTVGYLLQKDYGRVLERLQTWFKRHDADTPALVRLEIALYHALNKTNDELFALLADIRKKRPRSSAELKIDTRIGELIAQYPLLANISAGLAIALSHTVLWALKENIPRALDEFIAVSQNLEIADNDVEAYILLGQNLSADADNAGAYIYFKKVWISFLIDDVRKEEAQKELDEFEQILPGDEDFAVLRQRLNDLNGD